MARPVYDCAVNGDTLAATDDYGILGLEFLDADCLHGITAQNVRRLGLEADKLPYGLGRFITRGALYVFAEEDQRQQHSLGEEIQLHILVYRQSGIGAVDIDDRRRQGN